MDIARFHTFQINRSYRHERAGKIVGLGYIHDPDGITRDLVAGAAFEIEIACERFPATASLTAFFDPSGIRAKA